MRHSAGLQAMKQNGLRIRKTPAGALKKLGKAESHEDFF